MPALTTHGLTKRYGDTYAIRDLDLTVDDGEVYGFLGPNGAGKSTTIGLLMSYIQPDKGDCTVLGVNPHDDVVDLHERIGILPDRFGVYDSLTGCEHLDYVIDAKDANDDPHVLLDRVGLPEAAEQRAGTYSRGMQQRLALAMALVGEPELLILDEPFTGLDPHGARRIREIVYEENSRGATVFFSSHVLGQVELVCDRVGILHHGNLITEGRIADLREHSEVESALVFETDHVPAGVLEELRALEGVIEATADETQVTVVVQSGDVRWPVIEVVEKTGMPVDSVTVREASIEDVFTAYTTSRTEE